MNDDDEYIYLRDHTKEAWKSKFLDPEYLIIFERNVLAADIRQVRDENFEIDTGVKILYKPYRRLLSVKRRDIERD